MIELYQACANDYTNVVERSLMQVVEQSFGGWLIEDVSGNRIVSILFNSPEAAEDYADKLLQEFKDHLSELDEEGVDFEEMFNLLVDEFDLDALANKFIKVTGDRDPFALYGWLEEEFCSDEFDPEVDEF